MEKPLAILLLAVVQLTSSTLIINEINADNPGTDNVEFIELHNTGNETVAMDTYTLVLYNGNGDVAYDVIRLTGQSIPAFGYFVIGSRDVDPTPQFVLASSSNLFQNGPDAIALYSGNPSRYTSGMAVTADGLVDAVVSASHSAPGLTGVLTPGQTVLHEDENFHTGDESLSRCGGTQPLMTSQFAITYSTPGSDNSCNSTGHTSTAAGHGVKCGRGTHAISLKVSMTQSCLIAECLLGPKVTGVCTELFRTHVHQTTESVVSKRGT
ncbi:hypothetical protein Bbelb_325760 [Branchiostoma belcheri]|nr:hypothetical protein Bbelb_325760 [Branchiostoma belcheri]